MNQRFKAVLVTGSRNHPYPERVRGHLEAALLGVSLLVEGACPGAASVDTIAHKVARGLGVKTRSLPADWKRHGAAAGPIRNGEMVEFVLGLPPHTWDVLVLAFPGPTSRGTLDCIRQAQAVGLPVQIVNLDGEE